MTDHHHPPLPEPTDLPPTSAESSDEMDELIERAAENADLPALRRLAATGNPTAIDQLVETATELDDRDELRRLADRGNTDAAEILAELSGNQA
ncbi:hypothetical protein ABZX40_29430 [Streptomyces sp. NPDC004610]|uniref:hypothetical protein n=1 Tax=unclassified Streptomyces TaxID=2593676 RepID=UPI00339E55E8